MTASICKTFHYQRNPRSLSTITHISGECLLGHFTILFQYCAGGKIEKNEMGGACGAYGGGERCAQGSGGET